MRSSLKISKSRNNDDFRISKGYTKEILGMDREEDIDKILKDRYDMSIIEDVDEEMEDTTNIDDVLKYINFKTSSLNELKTVVHEIKYDTSLSISYKAVLIIRIITDSVRKSFSEWIPKRIVNIGSSIINATIMFLSPWHLSVPVVMLKNAKGINKQLMLYAEEENYNTISDKIFSTVDIGLLVASGAVLFGGHDCSGNLGCLAVKSILLFIL